MNGITLLVILLFPAVVHCCYYQGETYDHGDEWIINNAFVMNCTHEANGRRRNVVVACISPHSQTRLQINETRREGGHVFKCEQNPYNKTVKLVPMPIGGGDDARCAGGRRPGEKWVENSFHWECLPGGRQRPLGCDVDGTIVPMNGAVAINNVRYECRQYSNGSLVVTRKPLGNRLGSGGIVRTECRDQDGNRREYGAYWVRENFQWECKDGGRIAVSACVPDPGVIVPLGTKTLRYGREYQCKLFNNGTITLRQSFDSENQPNCVDQEGGSHAYKTSWVEDANFNKTCLEGGRVIVANCVTPSGYRVPVNGYKTENGVRYSCIKRQDGSMQFKTEGIGKK